MEIGSLPSAQMSPRIVNGVIKWYAGDTFELQVDIQLQDQDGENITIGQGESIEFAFFNRKRELVKLFLFENIENNCVTLVFDDEVTALFPAGHYTYDVYYNSAVRRTLSNDSLAVVE